jgi:Low affinity iron permease
MKTSHRLSSNERSKDKLDQLSSQIAIESRGDTFRNFATTVFGWARVEVGVRRGYPGYRDRGYHRTLISLFRYLAACHQYRTDDRPFLMVFLIQNTQNRDARAINLKLNVLIRATEAAGDQMMNIESLSDEELDVMHARYERIRAEYMERQRRGKAEREAAALRSQDEVSR